MLPSLSLISGTWVIPKAYPSFSCARAASATASGVNPKRCWRSFNGADMPNDRIAIVVPVGPT